jgi:hypothetical protein
MIDEIFEALTAGLHSFRDAFHETLPLACIGVYTIWRGNEFMYVESLGETWTLPQNTPYIAIAEVGFNLV